MAHDIQHRQEQLAQGLLQLAQRTFPVKGGVIAKRHFQDNFRQGGFVDGGLNAWQATKRQLSGSKSAAARYGPLMSSRKNLFSGLNYTPGVGRTILYNDVPYAPIHQFGGVTHPRVTPKMRAFAWAQYYREAGVKPKAAAGEKQGKKADRAKTAEPISEQALMWKRMALTKKATLTVRIPKRPFMGESRELNTKIKAMMAEEINKLLKNGRAIP